MFHFNCYLTLKVFCRAKCPSLKCKVRKSVIKQLNLRRLFRVTANVFGLCVQTGFGAQNCQPELNLNRSTKFRVCTSPRLTQNPCYGQFYFSSSKIIFFCCNVFFMAFSRTFGSALFIRAKYSTGTTCQDKPYLSLHHPQELSCPPFLVKAFQ